MQHYARIRGFLSATPAVDSQGSLLQKAYGPTMQNIHRMFER